jgi:hypothetical protein
MKGIVELLIRLIHRLIIFPVSLNFPSITQIKTKIIKYTNSHHIKAIVNSMKSEHVSDWFCITSGQLWSFKLEDAHNQLHAHSDHYSPLNDGSRNRTIKDMKDFFYWRKSGYPAKKFQRIEDKNWSHRVMFSYWTHHQPCDISEEGSHTWRWSNYSIKDSWSAWFERRRPIGDFQSTGSPIGNRSSPGLMTCSGASDDTSIFTRTRKPLNIKDQTVRSTHKEVGSDK